MSSMPAKHAQDRPITLVRSLCLGRPASPAVRLYTGGQLAGDRTEGNAAGSTVGWHHDGDKLGPQQAGRHRCTALLYIWLRTSHCDGIPAAAEGIMMG